MAASGQAGAQAVCPLGVCDGTGWILGPEDVARACDCRERTISRARLRGVASVIPPKYRGVSFDRPPVTEIPELPVRRVRDYCRKLDAHMEAGRGLWFFGDPGTGKTTLAMLVSKTALEAGHSVAIYSLPKLLTRIRRTYDERPGEQSYAELFDRLATVDLLHIDDLGAENRTEWVLEQLYSLINERYESSRSLMVTTNHDPEELEKQLGDRIVSRLVEMCDVVHMFGTDNRWTGGDAAFQQADGPEADAGGTLGPLD